MEQKPKKTKKSPTERQKKRIEAIKEKRLLKKQQRMLPVFRSAVRKAVYTSCLVKFDTLLTLSKIVRVPLKKNGAVIVEYQSDMVNPCYFDNIDEVLKMARIEENKLQLTSPNKRRVATKKQ